MQVAIVSRSRGVLRMADRLRQAGVRAQHCGTLAEVSELIELYELDLVLVDTLSGGNLPGAVRSLRAVHQAVPVIAFGVDPDRATSIACFSAGADDVVAWPGDAELIAARIRAIVRRCRGADTAALQVGPLCFDMIHRSLQVNNRPLMLTSKEYDLLEYMVTRKNRLIPKDTLLNQLYGGKDAPDARIIDVFVCKLRKKLALYGVHELIETVRGLGYRLDERGCRFSLPPVPTRNVVLAAA